MKTHRALLMLLTVAGSAALAGCQTSQATSASSSGSMSRADLDFITSASDIIRFDRDECTVAQTQARSPRVRELATKLLAEANEFDARLQPIAAAAGIKPPNVLPSTLRIRAARLRLGQGVDFDRSFLADQIVSHQDALNLQETEAAVAASNPQLVELSNQGKDLVRANLQTLEALQRQIS